MLDLSLPDGRDVTEVPLPPDCDPPDPGPEDATTDGGDANRPPVPGLVLTDTDPRDLLPQTAVTPDGTVRELGLTERLAQPLAAPAATPPATDKQVASAVERLMDGYLRHNADGWFAWDTPHPDENIQADANSNDEDGAPDEVRWRPKSVDEVVNYISELISRPSPGSAITRALIPYTSRNITPDLGPEIAAATGGTWDSATKTVTTPDGRQHRTWAFPSTEWAESRSTALAAVSLLAGKSSVVLPAGFDADPDVINARGTLISIRPGQPFVTSPLRRHDLIRKSLGTHFDPEAVCPQWMRFVAEICSVTHPKTRQIIRRRELEQFLRMLVGMSLVGRVLQQIIIVMHNELGNNGKSVFMLVLQHLFKDYFAVLPKAALMEKRGDAHTTDLTTLIGARIGAVKEIPRGMWDCETAKDLSSNEDLTARKMRQDNTPWTPTHTLWTTSNNTPKVPAGEQALWRRILIVPFKQRWFAPNDTQLLKDASIGPIDPTLADKLKTELPGILNWALEGLQDFYTNGFTVPQIVLDATKAAREDGSVWAAFIAKSVDVTGDASDILTWADVWKLWRWYRLAFTEGSKAYPNTKGDVKNAFAREVPTSVLVENAPGKRHIAEYFSGVRLTDEGRRWLAAAGKGATGHPYSTPTDSAWGAE